MSTEAVATIDRLIVNSPYYEPERFWRYDRETRMFTLLEGERRPAGYVVATPRSKSFDDPGVFHELPLVNQIRPRVAEWRNAGWPGTTAMTRRLLSHWFDPEERRDRRFFFCQLEAIETLIWLIIASGTDGKQARLGYHAPGRWNVAGIQRPEIMISGEGLRRTPREVLATLLHEAAHALAFEHGIKDTSRQGRYHNKQFKIHAEELGLAVEHDDRNGWSASTITPPPRPPTPPSSPSSPKP